MTGEFAAIEAIRSALPGPPPDGQEWIGDDAAVLRVPSGPWLLLATDAVVSGVHADLSLTGLDDFGWKAVAAAVSDIAAMGGEPGHAVVSVACPTGTDVDRLYEGVGAAAMAFACPVVGGDLVGSATLVVSVAVTGVCDGQPVLRSGARPGDAIYVTRQLGAAAAGLRLYRASGAGARPPGSGGVPDLLRRAHARPAPDLAGGRAARTAGATAMIDVSDGLGAEVAHVAEASGVGMRLDEVPVADGATLEEALGGGEDFALLFCIPSSVDPGRAFAGLTPPVRIGTCTADPSERTFQGRPLPASGWEHGV